MSSVGHLAAESVPERSERSAVTEAAILDAARDILAEGGLEALSMRVVAERVGLSATAIYHHFKGKDALIARVVQDGFRRIGDCLRQAADRHPHGSIERLLALGEGYVQFAFENEAYFRVLYNIQARIPRDMEELPEGGGYHFLRQCVVDAMEAGTVRDGNPDLIAHYLWTNVHGLVTLSLACNVEGPPDCPGTDVPMAAVDLFRSFSTFLIDGLRAGPRPEGSSSQTNSEA
jgi:AcrR family transcriptional regulator